MITTVNLMQNPEDIVFDKDSSYSKEYLIQALANLGQRIGIKGDGISYKSFTFNDILIESNNYSSNDYVGYITYIKSNDRIKALFGISNKFNLEETYAVDSSFDINNTLNFNSELSFSIPICGIEKYAKNSICINNNNELTFMLACKQIGYDDDDENNTILLYYKFDTLTNKPICCYKLYHYLKDDNGENYYCLLNLNNKTQNTYELSINIFNSSLLITDDDDNSLIHKQNFENLFKYSNYESTVDIEFSIINRNYEDVNKLLSYSSNNLYFNSAIAIILNSSKSKLYHSKTIELYFDTQRNELLSDNNDQLDNAKEFFYNEYKLNLNKIIFDINEEINKLYVNIFNYYNEKFYLEKRATLIKRILLKIYEKSIDYKQTLGKKLYIPLNYEFHYICNSNNELNIYYSNNIYITYTSLKNINLNKFWDSNNNLIFDYEDLNKLKVYNFEVNYNSYIENLINSIHIKDVYTMPYINANNNWCINDSDTKIKAVGKDAGNPNIIIVYSNDINNTENSYKLLNTISNKEEILKSSFEQKWFNVHNALFENTYDVKIDCCAYIPEVTNDNYEYFKDSMILSISDLNCLRYDEYKDKYKGSYILTLWYLSNENNEDTPQFEYIQQVDADNALALGSTVNILNELSDTSIANLNSLDLILLKSIISNVAQERLNVNANNWLVIKNKQSEEYSSVKNEYNNDLNMIMQYDDNITVSTNHIVHSHSNSRYISNISNIVSTNSLYPKYEYNVKTETIKDGKISVLIQKLSNATLENSTITVNGKTITNVESLIEKLKNKLENAETSTPIKEIKTTSVVSTNTNYYEYIFNNNVPTLDYKEIFARNVNLLNRLNLISIDNNGNLYNGYIGTSYNESDKSTLHIGTSNLNINVGSDTLIKEEDRNKFNKHNTLSIDFDNIKLNASKRIDISKELCYTFNYANLDFKLCNIKLIGNLTRATINSNDQINQINTEINTLFVYDYNNDVYYLCINDLMNKMNININSYLDNQININSNYGEHCIATLYTILNGESSVKSIYHFIKLSTSDIYNNDALINKNILYAQKELELMYYEDYVDDNNVSNTGANRINIFLTFK